MGIKDILSAEEIAGWSESIEKHNILIFNELDSTNNKAKELAGEGAAHGTLVLAEKQTAGKGRMGRQFISPEGSGIYFSLVMRPKVGIEKAVLITSAAAVAVCGAIRELTGKDAGIKWVNDVYIGGKKVCGILTEAAPGAGKGHGSNIPDSVIVGIGINFTADPDAFPEDVRQKICWVYEYEEPEITRNRLIARVSDKLLKLCGNLEDKSFLKDYKKQSVILGKDILFIRGNESQAARAVDIDENGGLIVIKSDGERVILASGEISIRW